MILKILRKLLYVPVWALGLECNICKMTFLDQFDHYDYVKNNKKLLAKHKNKIPILK
jgi:hypothetical protein